MLPEHACRACGAPAVPGLGLCAECENELHPPVELEHVCEPGPWIRSRARGTIFAFRYCYTCGAMCMFLPVRKLGFSRPGADLWWQEQRQRLSTR